MFGDMPASTETAGAGGWVGGLPNAQTMAAQMDMNPTGMRAAMAALGLANPALGFGLGAVNALGNLGNTVNNVGMLNGLGVNPGFGSTVGGLLGFNGLAGTPTGALNAAMANQYAGFANLSTPQFSGDLSDPMAGYGGWGDIASAMDAANAAASAGGTASSPSGGMADRGDISSETLGSFQKGGYTGAGRDGVVQPHKPAGIVHEGEYVIPAHMVRKMMGRGMLG